MFTRAAGFPTPLLAYIIMKRKLSYTELQSVVLPCLEITAYTLHGKKAIDKIRQISLLSRKTQT